MPRAFLGEAIEKEEAENVEGLRRDCWRSNKALVQSLREDPLSSQLLELTVKDAQLHRMTKPVGLDGLNLEEIRLVPRFAIQQGEKVRAIDNFSWSAPVVAAGPKPRAKLGSVNGHTVIHEGIRHDHLDQYTEMLRAFVAETSKLPHLWKADIDSAFRRLPLRAEHRWAAAVAFKHQGQACIGISAHTTRAPFLPRSGS